MTDPKKLTQRQEAPDAMDRMNTAAGRKFAESHVNAAAENLMAGRRWDAQPKAKG